MNESKPFAFVLMPFLTSFDDIYQFGIKQACEEIGIIAARVDEQQFSGTILDRIYRQIESADIIVADMTDQNPNVFYEVGYSHALNKLCVLATQSASDIPFDLKQHAHVIYNGTATDLRKKLLPKLEWAKSEAEKGKKDRVSVTTRVLGPALTIEEYAHTGSFDLVIDLRNQTTQRSPEIEAIYVRVSKAWRATAHGKDCPFEVVNEEKSKRFLLTPSIKRLAPNGFSQERITLSKTFWTKWNGDEQREVYASKGLVSIELSTSEGQYTHERTVDVQFEELPF